MEKMYQDTMKQGTHFFLDIDAVSNPSTKHKSVQNNVRQLMEASAIVWPVGAATDVTKLSSVLKVINEQYQSVHIGKIIVRYFYIVAEKTVTFITLHIE